MKVLTKIQVIRTRRLCEGLDHKVFLKLIVAAAVVAAVAVASQLVGFVLIWFEDRNSIAWAMVAVGECIAHALSSLAGLTILWRYHVQEGKWKRVVFGLCGMTVLSALAVLASGMSLFIHDATGFLLVSNLLLIFIAMLTSLGGSGRIVLIRCSQYDSAVIL